MIRRLITLSTVTLIALLGSCGGGSGDAGTAVCTGICTPPTTVTDFLTIDDVQRVIAQAASEATARKQPATIAVVDRVGNVLGVFRMTGAKTTFRIGTDRGVTGGLEGIDILPDTFAALTKALTGAYLSSNGNAFSTRTASQIIQENFNPREFNQPSGPLYGVQFSQLSCSDLMRRATDGTVGPKRSPLGLAADPGGLPLYKNDRLVGAIGVISDGVYGLDPDITDIDQDTDELIAVAGTTGYAAPDDIRANRITADGRTFRFVDSESLLANPAQAPAFASVSGAMVAVAGYFDAPLQARQGVSYGNAASGFRADTGTFASLGAFVLVDSNNQNRYPVRDGTDGQLKAAEVTTILQEALKVAFRARAQIRRPLGSTMQATVVIVDTNGEVLATARTPDGPLFGIDVALQKARTAMLFSSPNAAAEISALPSASYIGAGSIPTFRSFGGYMSTARQFFNDQTMFSNGVAFSNRAIATIARPLFPDGISGTGEGPFSTPYSNWSPFHLGLQLDLSYNAIIASATGSPIVGCTGLSRAKNGIQIFPGSFPIYRNSQLVGGIGVSGDGIDQDDMVSFLGLANAGKILGTGIGHAPKSMRADSLVPRGEGTRLRYVNCPQAPFNDSTEQNVCEGL
ncbi:MAG: heme-binding protein [Betaproteobacteria bacterium]